MTHADKPRLLACPATRFVATVLLTTAVCVCGLLVPQVGAQARATTRRSATASVPLSPGPAGGHRQLAPGVFREVPIEKSPKDTSSRHDVVELLKVNPNFAWAKDIRFEHPIWQLEFSYKPVRFIDVDVPTPSGKLERKRVWYLMFKVRNPGPEPVPFYPWFVLESRDEKIQKAYPDRVIPVAMPLIAAREDRTRSIHSTVDLAGEIPPSGPGEDKSVWGVATWTDIDPRIDQFSIYVSGLTNGYQWTDDPVKGRLFKRKMLELNFWRPGDEYHEHEQEIRVGTPDKQEYRWVFR